MLATATLIALTALPAGVAQASQAEERGQRVQERTWAEKHHTVPAPANPATPAAELRTQAREQGAYPAPTGQQTANAPVPAEPSKQPDWLVLGLGVLAAALALSTGLAVLAARRANRRARVGQAA
jgi:hypothetical protein